MVQYNTTYKQDRQLAKILNILAIKFYAKLQLHNILTTCTIPIDKILTTQRTKVTNHDSIDIKQVIKM